MPIGILPTPAETRSGATWDNARMTVSATMLPGQKRAIVGAGKTGLQRVPSGATILIGRVRPEFWGTNSWVALSSRIERSVR